MSSAEWIAVDWGTSNVRLWGIDAAGEISFSESSDQGMGKLSREQYPGVLAGMLAGRGGSEVLVCGMAGARQGWLEAPYVETPASLNHLANGAVRPDADNTGIVARILPGVCQRDPSEEVMRGEETQLLGLLTLRPGFEGTVIMPGTHSKWVRIAGGRIEAFRSAMTGEIYDVLGTHSVLRHSLTGERNGPETEAGIAAGLEVGLDRPGELPALLFRTRTAALLGNRGADWCSGYLSGLLVGAEIGGLRDWLTSTNTVPLVGSERLCQLYGRALDQIGVKSEAIDATSATLAGLKAARAQGTT